MVSPTIYRGKYTSALKAFLDDILKDTLNDISDIEDEDIFDYIDADKLYDICIAASMEITTYDNLLELFPDLEEINEQSWSTYYISCERDFENKGVEPENEILNICLYRDANNDSDYTLEEGLKASYALSFFICNPLCEFRFNISTDNKIME